MIRAKDSTTVLLVIIVIILLIGVGVAIYYVLDLDWFEKTYTQIYNETPNQNEQNVEIKVEKEIKYDMTKRTYNIVENTNEFKIVLYKDGTIGITMLENKKYNETTNYTNIVNTEIRLSLNDIIRAYEVKVSTDSIPKSYILLLDIEGNLHKLVEQELISNGKYAFVKIEGLAKIIDVRQITNEGLTENVNGLNAMAIDQESNEILLTNYLLN